MSHLLSRGGDLMSNPNTVSRFDEIYYSTNKAALAFIIAKCGRTADVSDIFQDVYMELYQILCKRGADYITNETALVFKLAKRKVARYYSSLQRLRSFVLPIAAGAEDESGSGLADFEDESFLTEDFAVSNVLIEDVRKYLFEKPEIVQKIFFLRYDADLSIPEIAGRLSVNESYVKNKLYRTLKELRELLE